MKCRNPFVNQVSFFEMEKDGKDAFYNKVAIPS